jgi:chemotaxis protein MotB
MATDDKTATSPPRPIIVVRRKKAGHAGHHGGAWKVAYADFVTAMMALFIVLWLMSSDKEIQDAVGAYFSDPTGIGKQVGTAGSGHSIDLPQEDMKKLQEKLEQALATIPQFQNIKDQVEITITNDGLRIELLETEAGMFFESGKPRPTQTGSELLSKLAGEVGRLPNNLLIEGHTDAKPFSGDREYSNWELSADRANSARKIMESAGVRPEQVNQVRGFADRQLRHPDDPTQASNRRVSVIVQYMAAPKKTEAGAEKKAGPAAGKPEATPVKKAEPAQPKKPEPASAPTPSKPPEKKK